MLLIKQCFSFGIARMQGNAQRRIKGNLLIQHLRENPGIIKEIPGPLPSSGEVRTFRWNEDYRD